MLGGGEGPLAKHAIVAMHVHKDKTQHTTLSEGGKSQTGGIS